VQKFAAGAKIRQCRGKGLLFLIFFHTRARRHLAGRKNYPSTIPRHTLARPLRRAQSGAARDGIWRAISNALLLKPGQVSLIAKKQAGYAGKKIGGRREEQEVDF
jgi:hypothetical protein